MRKKDKQSKLTVAGIGLMIIAFLVICLSSRSCKSKESINRLLIESCQLQRVENASFNPEAEVIVVLKHFGNNYTERSRYYLPLLPTISAALSHQRQMLFIMTATGKQVAFDKAGNAYVVVTAETTADIPGPNER